MTHAHDFHATIRRHLRWCLEHVEKPGFPDDPSAIREVRLIIDGLQELFHLIDSTTDTLDRLPGPRPTLLDPEPPIPLSPPVTSSVVLVMPAVSETLRVIDEEVP